MSWFFPRRISSCHWRLWMTTHSSTGCVDSSIVYMCGSGTGSVEVVLMAYVSTVLFPGCDFAWLYRSLQVLSLLSFHPSGLPQQLLFLNLHMHTSSWFSRKKCDCGSGFVPVSIVAKHWWMYLLPCILQSDSITIQIPETSLCVLIQSLSVAHMMHVSFWQACCSLGTSHTFCSNWRTGSVMLLCGSKWSTACHFQCHLWHHLFDH